MVIAELGEGTDLVLEIQWYDHHYEVPTKIVHNLLGKVYLETVRYHGQVVDLGRPQNFKHIAFHLYAMNPDNEERLTWRNVGLELRQFNGTDVYEVKVNNFKTLGKNANRRREKRLPLDQHKGKVFILRDGEMLDVNLVDISSMGIAFQYESKKDLVGETVRIGFQDRVHGNAFTIQVEAKVVREKFREEDCSYLYGCKIEDMDQDGLTYLCLRHAELSAMEH